MEEIYNLANLGYSLNRISIVLNIPRDKVFKYFQNSPYYPYYLSNGEIIYSLNKPEEISILTKPEEETITALCLSDSHIGNVKENPKLLDIAYNYCIKNNIHLIFFLGDLIDGMLEGNGKKIHASIKEQIDYAIKIFPYDKNITVFTIGGNHDISAKNTEGIDLLEILKEERSDFVPLGYGLSKVAIKNDYVYFRHYLGKTILAQPELLSLILQGHSHKSKIKVLPSGMIIVNIPSISEIKMNNMEPLPGATKMTLNLKKGIINEGIFEQFAINNDFIRVNECEIYLGRGKQMKKDIKNEIKTLTRKKY